MGKIVFAAILCLLSSCKSASRYTYDEQKYNLIIEYNPWIKIDLNNRVAIMEFHDFKSVDTLDLTATSIDAIKSSFEKNRIGIIHGDVSYGDALELPTWGLRVKIFRAEKLQAYLSIFNEIHFNNSPVSEGDNQTFKNLHALRGELSWTHYRLLLKIEKEGAREFYMDECIEGSWSTRTLERQINSLYYERILMSGKEDRPMVKAEAENNKEKLHAADIIKDPYVLEFLDLKANVAFYERDLEQAIINKLQEFLLELGKGFSFVARQYRLPAGPGKNFYADLVFYNYILKCFLVIDLKTGELTHQDIGQMDMYVRYFENQVRRVDDNPTIGLILCTEKNKTVVKYSLLNDSKQIFASKYKLYLPTEEELQKEIARERELIETEKRLKE